MLRKGGQICMYAQFLTLLLFTIAAPDGYAFLEAAQKTGCFSASSERHHVSFGATSASFAAASSRKRASVPSKAP